MERPTPRGGLAGTMAVLIVGILSAAPCAAQIPVGEEFIANSFTTSGQLRPGLAMQPDGSFVVVWNDSYPSGGDVNFQPSIEARRFDRDGTPLDDRFQVSAVTYAAYLPAAAPLPEGGFLVVWSSLGSAGDDASADSIQGRRYDSDGRAMGPQFQVNSYTTAMQQAPRVATSPDGGFVVTWWSEAAAADSSGRSVAARRFASDGSPLAEEFQVNTTTLGDQFYPTVAMGPEGGFVVVWHSDLDCGQAFPCRIIQGQRYSSSGALAGGELQVNTEPPVYFHVYPDVAANEDGFVVVWQSDTSPGSDDSRESIQGRRFTTAGDAIGDQFQVNSITERGQRLPVAILDRRGEFVVAWRDEDALGYGTVLVRHFLSDGTPFAPDLVASFPNEFPTPRSRVRIAGGDAGEFVVAWDNYELPPPFTGDVFARVFRTETIFSDGFESGDVSVW